MNGEIGLKQNSNDLLVLGLHAARVGEEWSIVQYSTGRSDDYATTQSRWRGRAEKYC